MSLYAKPASNTPRYTLPALQIFHHDTFDICVDPETIARNTEQYFADPPVHIDDPWAVRASDQIRELARSLRPLLVPLTATGILKDDPEGAKWYKETRETRMKRSIEEYSAKMGGERAWKRARSALNKLSFKDEGPFILGSTGVFLLFIHVELSSFQTSQLG